MVSYTNLDGKYGQVKEVTAKMAYFALEIVPKWAVQKSRVLPLPTLNYMGSLGSAEGAVPFPTLFE